MTSAQAKFPREIELLNEKRVTLGSQKKTLTDSIAQLETDANRYRTEYQQKSWAKAMGEKLGNIKLKSGREYLNVTITRVTDVGLEISHENGFARIAVLDLDSKLRDRFQLGLVKRPTAPP